ncbi:unnamed protein product [Coregonus sp. 'balchen']|nr:unnamed protein product [Coregonus sp. 'balchen']
MEPEDRIGTELDDRIVMEPEDRIGTELDYRIGTELEDRIVMEPEDRVFIDPEGSDAEEPDGILNEPEDPEEQQEEDDEEDNDNIFATLMGRYKKAAEQEDNDKGVEKREAVIEERKNSFERQAPPRADRRQSLPCPYPDNHVEQSRTGQNQLQQPRTEQNHLEQLRTAQNCLELDPTSHNCI